MISTTPSRLRNSFLLLIVCTVCTQLTLCFQCGWRGRSIAISGSTNQPVLWATSTDTQPVPLSRIKNTTFWESAIRGPPIETKPDYDTIVGPLGRFVDRIFLTMFRNALAEQTQLDSSFAVNDYRGIIDIALKMNRKYSDRTLVQTKALQVLKSLFPSWLPSAYSKLFSAPFPRFSARMNAWATKMAGTWLMGECEINDIVLLNEKGTDEAVLGISQGLLVKRCRFLEESGCASVCVNSCKIPTQTFFSQEMGLALTMEPNYETFECQFSFGRLPNEIEELEAKNVPCLMRCPTAGSIRKQHSSSVITEQNKKETVVDDLPQMRPCDLMEDSEK
jgi:hypothetical protein